MKQKLHEPLAVEKQVVILYALTHGFLDSVPVNKVLDFEAELFEYIEANQADVFETIRATKDLPEESLLNDTIKAFKDIFMAANTSRVSAQDKMSTMQNA